MVKKVTTARGGARKRTSEKPPDSDSDAISSGFESEVSEDDGSIEDFAFDAIKWASYDKTFGRPGWSYAVMWGGYLKSKSDSVIPVANFGEDGKTLEDFWKDVRKRHPELGKIIKGQKEPPGKIGDFYEPSDTLLRRWFIDSAPRRNYDAYKNRPSGLINQYKAVRKADSDYYINRREKRLIAKGLLKVKASGYEDEGEPLPKASTSHRAKVKRIASASPEPFFDSSSSPFPHAPGSHHATPAARSQGKSADSPSRFSPEETSEVDAFLDDNPASTLSPALHGHKDPPPLPSTNAKRKRSKLSSDPDDDSASDTAPIHRVFKRSKGRSQSREERAGSKAGIRGTSTGAAGRGEGIGEVRGAGLGDESAGRSAPGASSALEPKSLPGRSGKSVVLAKVGRIQKKRPPLADDTTVAFPAQPPPSDTFGSPQSGIFNLDDPTASDPPQASASEVRHRQSLFTDTDPDRDTSPAFPASGIGGRVKQAPAGLKAAKSDDDEPQYMSGGPTSGGGPNGAASAPTERKKYVQPSRLKVIDKLEDPTPHRRMGRSGPQATPNGEYHIPRALLSLGSDRPLGHPAGSAPTSGPSDSRAGARPTPVPPAYRPDKDPRRSVLPSRRPAVPHDRHPLPARPLHSPPLSPAQAYDLPPLSPSNHAQQTPLSPISLAPLSPRENPATKKPTDDVIRTCYVITSLSPLGDDVTCEIAISRGSSSGSDREALSTFLQQCQKRVYCERVEAFCLTSHLGHGAQIIEWAKVECGSAGSAEVFKAIEDVSASEAGPMMFVAYFEATSVRISRHYAFVLASSRVVRASGWKLDSSQYSPPDDGLLALLLSLPLDSASPPLPPNPVRPAETSGLPLRRAITRGPIDPIASYGVSADRLAEYRDRMIDFIPAAAGVELSDLLSTVRDEAVVAGVSIARECDKPDVIYIENGRLDAAVSALSERDAWSAKASIVALGPSLNLLPSQWRETQVWKAGALVTFSPSFILSSPNDFHTAMRSIRNTPSCAAYILPAVIEWFNVSWCKPDPTKTLDALVRALSLDKHLLHLSSSAAGSFGGLAVSMAPPSVHQPEASTQWAAWLHSISTAERFDTLVDLCRGVRPGHYDSLPPHKQGGGDAQRPPPGDLIEADIQRSQIQDLIRMRMRPDVLPYRRYIYVGDVSFGEERRKAVASKGIEIVRPADFPAALDKAA